MRIEAIIFDLGGTLIRYTGSYAKWPDLETPGFVAAYNHLKGEGVELPKFLLFRDTGFAMLPGRWQQATSGKRNLRLIDLLAEVLQDCGVNHVTSTLIAEAAESYQWAVRSQAEPLPAAGETLIQVKSAGYKIGLISNTMFTGEAHRDDLNRFGLAPYFDTMLFSADVNMWKPDTAPYLQVSKDLGVSPDAAVFVGDDPAADVTGGHRAGMCTIHIRSGQRFAPADSVKPDAVIDSLREIPPLLSSWADGTA